MAVCAAPLAVHAGDPEPLNSQPFVVRTDEWPDAVARPTAAGGVVDLMPSVQTLPDLRSIKIGLWQPTAPAVDQFEGEWTLSGGFVRIDLTFDGWLNPPGPVNFESAGPPEPMLYGPNPVLGFLELDVDNNFDTGGELDAPQFRYLGAVGRFGARISSPEVYGQRMATSGNDFDTNFETPPYYEQSGEEFHLALFGEELAEPIIVRSGNDDLFFERGETWELRGYFLHRAHGFEDCTFGGGEQGIGVYEPLVALLFQHLTTNDTTVVSLVYQLDNPAAARVNGVIIVQPLNFNALDQSSVLEALTELYIAVEFALMNSTECLALPSYDLLQGWGEPTQPADYLDPRLWRTNALFGTILSAAPASAGGLVWTDVRPNAVPGDFDGDGHHDEVDAAQLMSWIQDHDGVGGDDDGTDDGAVTLPNFPANFNMLDTNYDGLVQTSDFWPPKLADGDGDFDVDLDDWSILASCITGPAPNVVIAAVPCETFDFTHDQDVDLKDAAVFQRVFPPDSGG